MQKRNNKANAIQYVYIVQGLGFGDDEDVWETCYTYKNKARADAKCASMLAEVEGTEVRVVAQQVL